MSKLSNTARQVLEGKKKELDHSIERAIHSVGDARRQLAEAEDRLITLRQQRAEINTDLA